ncbi:MAG: hypothetical protein GF347_03120 [Candidatus Moranbacteria bacterium]|nr:hypothetical protein [Candidatus Moranbacteria bacterium]
MQKQEINDRIEVEEEDIKQYYAEHSDEFSEPEKIELWEIYLKDKNTADRVAKLAKSGRNFEKLATQYTEREALKKKKGYLGFKAKNRRGEVSRKAFELGPDQISGPIKFQAGWVVFKTGEKKEKTIKSYEDARSQARAKLRNQLTSERREAWEKELREKYKVEINHKLVESL